MHRLEILGLGAGTLEQLPLGIYRKLIETDKQVYLRTKEHPVVEALEAEGLVFESFDAFYESASDFKTVYERIVATLVEKVKAGEAIIYAVPGHPMLAEQTVQLLLQEPSIEVSIVGGQSYLDDLFTALHIDPIEGFQFVDATNFSRDELVYRQHMIFSQVYDEMVASEVKLTLLEDLPYDYEVAILEAVGTDQESITYLPLEDLDRRPIHSNLTSIYVPPVKEEELLRHQFSSLRKVIRTLRGPEGCPWDRKQTHRSLRPYAVEEVYELLDAIDREDDEAIVEELGDVLLQVMLHSQIGEDDGYFTIDDVIRTLVEKMIHRHPHVFSTEKIHKTWEELKREEKGKTASEGLLASVIMEGPSLQVAEKLQRRAAKIGFDWSEVDEVWAKWEEEKEEFFEAVNRGNHIQQEEEFGDLLFVLANLARFYGIQSELALRQANAKFKRRFSRMEELAKEAYSSLDDLSLEEWDKLWKQVKKEEGSSDAFG